ncbi:MAG: pilus assembly protein [Porticoccaceae bacterium]|nr:pilus assembly protein [Porticoccaceae bacterium]
MAVHSITKKQQGAVAIEFAVLSVLFFALLYAIAAYALSFFFTLSLNHLSAEAARSAIRIDPAAENYQEAVSKRVTATIANFWSSSWIDGGCSAPAGNGEGSEESGGLIWTPLLAMDGKPSFGYLGSDGTPGQLLHVCIRMGKAPLPRLPGMAERFIPQGTAVTRL